MRVASRVICFLVVVAWAGFLSCIDACAAERNEDAVAKLFFERDIRPIFKAHCFQCHGEQPDGEPEGGLDVRLRRWLVRGGDEGPAVVPGMPAASLFVQRIRDGEMPPEDVQGRLSPVEIRRLEQWVKQGALTARAEPEELSDQDLISDEERRFWAFQPVQRPALPLPPAELPPTARMYSPIDYFLLARMQSKKLAFSPPADRYTLIRRVYFDLWGLPPTPREVQQFVEDPAEDAYQRLLDRLLASPRYAERWGRHWLDVAGYADSEGYTDEDPVRPDAYRYRDYVLRSFLEDKPYDTFVVEQLAGDELVHPPYAELPPAALDQLIATGFLRMAPDGTGMKVDQGVARNQTIADTIETVSTSLLGLTVGCARCHNHRYDPISQADYYRFRAVFEPALNWKAWKTPSQRRISLYRQADRERAAEIEREAKQVEQQRLARQAELIERTLQRELEKLPEEIRGAVRAARDAPAKTRTDAQRQLLKDHPSTNVTASSLYLYDRKAADELKVIAERAKKIRATKPQEAFIRAISEQPSQPLPSTFVFARGDHQQPKQEVAPGELTILCLEQPPTIPVADPDRPTAGRRLAYARWLTSGKHPLLARVAVNRIWMHHFGRGIVVTPGDFGALGSRPTHPALLDWLADEFVRQGWSIKRMHRLMMTSTAYRQQALIRADAAQVDAENSLYWRMPVRRLDAEQLRDALLAVSGQLDARFTGPPVPVMADRVGQFVLGIENLNAGRPGPVIPLKGEQFRRSVYTQFRRSRPLSVMEPFDLPRMTPNCTERASSTVATQSLLLMNSPLVHDRARQLADRLTADAGKDTEAQVRLAWQLAYGRPPASEDVQAAVAFVADQAEHFTQAKGKATQPKAASPSPSPRDEALVSFCHALLSSSRFLYLD